jgi:hypothetical protein
VTGLIESQTGRYLPLILFSVVYVATCLVGAVLMLLGAEPFVGLFEYFSGTQVPDLSLAQLAMALILLIIAPLFFVLGFHLGTLVSAGETLQTRLRTSVVRLPEADRPRVAVGVFVVSLLIALASLVRANTVSDIGSWLDYSQWIDARASTFRSLSFFEFANIYLFLPVAAAWVIVTRLEGTGLRRLLVFTPVVPVLLVDFLIFQRKTAISSLIIIATAWLIINQRWIGARNLRRGSIVAILTGLTIYTAAVMVPVYSQVSGSTCGVGGAGCGAGSFVPATLTYAALSPLTRTSAPALYYPVIYPGEHPFYGLDVGQDVLGFGASPDDNLVVWERMNHNLKGSTAAPFQFNLYSQVGVVGALAGSFLIGFGLCLAWRLTASLDWHPVWECLAGALVLLFSIDLAIDSFRNSLIVSYGVGWGLVFLALTVIALATYERVRRAFRLDDRQLDPQVDRPT